MSNWRPIILGDLNAASVSGKVAIIQSAAAARTLPDPAPAAIANVTLELRGAIGFSGKYIVDQDNTALPTSLLELAIAKIVRGMSRAIDLPFSPDDTADERTYEARLEKIRQGNWPIETADNPVTVAPVQSSVVMPAIHARERQWSRRDQEGI